MDTAIPWYNSYMSNKKPGKPAFTRHGSKIAIGLVILIAAALAGISGYAYSKNHIDTMYGKNTVGTISVDTKKIPQGWQVSEDASADHAVISMPQAHGGYIEIKKVTDSSMHYSNAPGLATQLRQDSADKMIHDGHEIKMLPAGNIVLTTTTGKVRLPTVEWTEVAPFRYTRSIAYYVQDGYYISIERTIGTDYNTQLNAQSLLSITDAVLPTVSVTD